MNLLGWNCKGLRGLQAVRKVTNMVNVHKPLLIFLSETKRRTVEMDWLRAKWKFDNYFTMDCIGRVGGLSLLWMEEVKVEVMSFSKYHIDVWVGDRGDPYEWHFTGFYGEPKTNRRHHSWDLLRTLKSQSTLPWFCAGDFNEIL